MVTRCTIEKPDAVTPMLLRDFKEDILPIYDYLCECGLTTESIRGIDVGAIKCKCGKMAERIISSGKVYTGNQDDTSWARHGVEVMPKDSVHPETQEFIRNPTKGNYAKAMKAEGVRFMEPGEKGIDRSKRKPPMPPDTMAKLLQRNRRIEVGG